MREPSSQLGDLLRSYGVGTRYSLREAAKVSGVSRQTLSDIMKPLPRGDSANIRQQRKASLRKISAALDIPFDLIERAAMRDWGLLKSVSAATVQDVLEELRGLTSEELVQVQIAAAQLQAALVAERTTRADGVRSN